MKPVVLELMRDGFCRQIERISIHSGRCRFIEFEAMFAKIEHPTLGAILFDSGYGSSFDAVTRPFPNRFYRMVTPVTMHSPPAVVQAGSNIRHIFISHFHADHIGGLRDFPNARFHCAKAAWDAVKFLRGLSAVRHGFIPELMPDDFEARASFVERCAEIRMPEECAPFTHGRDVFGDGSIISVSLPGHAEGQTGIVVRESCGNLTFLVADGAWSRRAIREDAPPARVAGVLGNWRELTATLRKLYDLHHSNPLIRIIPTHCPEIWQD